MQNSKVEWTTNTFNIVWGCQRVSPGYQACYAETLAKRYGYDVWGPAKSTERRTMSENYWKQPHRWHATALKAPYGSERPRVFCGSMCDVFEDHPTNARERRRLWGTIGECDALDWLLLTKRPENILTMVPPAWAAGYWPDHVWIGTSVENQEYADKCIPELLKVPARVRFLSCEPLLGSLDIRWALHYMACPQHPGEIAAGWGHLPCDCRPFQRENRTGLEWIIVGGESGAGARPMSPAWARSLRDQCQAAGVAFHFKQWGQFTPYYEAVDPEAGKLIMSEYPNGTMKSVGKKAAGRLLDGRTWDEFPTLAGAGVVGE